MELDLTRGVSAIILAAGANARLSGIVPSFLKPLMVVNGRSLVGHARAFADSYGARQIVTVASPDNVRHMTQLIRSNDWVIQPEPTGIVNAIQRGIGVARCPATLLLCADNTFDLAADADMNSIPRQPFFGARVLEAERARRFTRYSASGYAARFIPRNNPELGNGCWIGPVLAPTAALRETLTCSHSIEDALTELRLLPYQMLCADHGVPEEVA